MRKRGAYPVERRAEPIARGQGEWLVLDSGSEGLEPSRVVRDGLGQNFFLLSPFCPLPVSTTRLPVSCSWDSFFSTSCLPLPHQDHRMVREGPGAESMGLSSHLVASTGRGPRPSEEAEQLSDVHPATPDNQDWSRS